jgi:Holliday junction resolvase RusA-like endonuclease
MADSYHFFMAIEKPPKATKQEHQVSCVIDVATGRPVPRFHPSRAWADAESLLRAHLEPHRPAKPIEGGVMLDVTWCFPKGGHADGAPYLARPDTDNLDKGLKDVMTELGWWKDDAQVFSEHVTKVYGRVPGIRIDIEEV